MNKKRTRENDEEPEEIVRKRRAGDNAEIAPRAERQKQPAAEPSESEFWNAVKRASAAHDLLITERKFYWEAHDAAKGIHYHPSQKSVLSRKIAGKELSQSQLKSLGRYWFETCQAVFEEFLHFRLHGYNKSMKINKCPSHVLDMCCAPGGFMTKMSERFPQCCFVGVTAPLAAGGLPMLSKVSKKKTARIYFQDLLHASASSSLWMAAAKDSDFVIADGSWWRQQGDETSNTTEAAMMTTATSNAQEKDFNCSNGGSRWEYSEIDSGVDSRSLYGALTQVQLGLSALAADGEMFVRANDPGKNVIWGPVYYILANVFERVELFRPSLKKDKKLRTRSFLYFHCVGFVGREAAGAQVLLATTLPELRACIERRAYSDLELLLRAESLNVSHYRGILAEKMEDVWRGRARMFADMRVAEMGN
eukprot:3569910-Rhodomonas_salina.1